MSLAPQFVPLVDSSGLHDLPTVAAQPANRTTVLELHHSEELFGRVVPLGQNSISWPSRTMHSKTSWEREQTVLNKLLQTPILNVGDEKVLISHLWKLRNRSAHLPSMESEVGQDGSDRPENVGSWDQSRQSLWETALGDVWDKRARSASFSQGAFLYLEHARYLLSEQRVEAARSVLARGAKHYPNDTKLSRLLRAISPGQVSKKNRRTHNKKKEMEWLAKHGEEYRGRWVAIAEGELLASSVKLESLLSQIRPQRQSERLPLIQFISSE